MSGYNIPAPHPGKRLKMEMASQGLSQRELADLLDLPPSHISGLVNGKRPITPAIALKLEIHWGTNAQIWIARQGAYDLAQERAKLANTQPEVSSEEEEIIDKYVAKKFFLDQKVITKNLGAMKKSLLNIFGIQSISQIPEKFSTFQSQIALYRKSNLKEDEIQRFCWESLALYRAREIEVPAFDQAQESNVVAELKRHFWSHYESQKFPIVQETKNTLAKHGIIFLIQTKPQKGPFDGYAFLSEGRPAIAMTLRHKRLDNFAFTLLHEVCHLFHDLENLDKIKHFDTAHQSSGEGNLIREVERRANEYAGEKLIDRDTWLNFRRYVKKDDDGIFYFANQHKIHPGILRGRLCRELKSYYKRKTTINKLNKLLV